MTAFSPIPGPRTVAPLAEELISVVKDRMKAFLVTGGHVPENLWWP